MDSKLNKKSDKGDLSNLIESKDIKITMNSEKSGYDMGVNQIELKIVNSGNNQIGFGEYYTIEKYVNNTWYEVPFKDNRGFDDILHIIKPGKTTKEIIDLSVLKYSLIKGKHRIIKEFYSDGDKLELAAEFSIN